MVRLSEGAELRACSTCVKVKSVDAAREGATAEEEENAMQPALSKEDGEFPEADEELENSNMGGRPDLRANA